MGYAALREEKVGGFNYLFIFNTKENSHNVKRSLSLLTCLAGH